MLPVVRNWTYRGLGWHTPPISALGSLSQEDHQSKASLRAPFSKAVTNNTKQQQLIKSKAKTSYKNKWTACGWWCMPLIPVSGGKGRQLSKSSNQPGPHSKFQDNQDHILSLCVETKRENRWGVGVDQGEASLPPDFTTLLLTMEFILQKEEKGSHPLGSLILPHATTQKLLAYQRLNFCTW